MAELFDIDLASLIADHGCRYLVDSGLDGVEAALDLDLEQIFAIESEHKKALELALSLAANHKVTVIHARLEKGLQEALDEMRRDLPALFRLVGPSAGSGLRQVAAGRDISRDVFLVDGDPAPALDDILTGTHLIDGIVARPRADTRA